jgi:spermidine synthase
LRALVVHALFFLSGISGLVYQVVWVRQFGNLFGNSVHSAAAVSGVFLCGLGLGSWWAGRWVDRRWRADSRSALRAYGGFELAIAALGLGIAGVLPWLEPLSAAISRYEVGPEGWSELSAGSHALRHAAAAVLLAPITFLMGGTLTLLIRHLVASELSAAGWRIGALYGVNTLGAACGAFLTDFALIPRLGITATELVAVGLNAAAGLGALGLARGPTTAARAAAPPAPVAPVAAPPAPAARAAAPVTGDARGRLLWTAAALFCSGLAAMGLQILWFRHLTGIVGSYRSVFSLLLTVILVGLWLGSTLGGLLARRLGRAALLYAAFQTGVVVATLAALAGAARPGFGAVPPGIAARWLEASAPGRVVLELGIDLWPILLLVGAPALLMGCVYPLANAHVQDVESEVGGRAGLLYLANTAGNLVGSLLAGFALLPLLGIQNSAGLLAGVGALAVFALARSGRAGAEADRPAPDRALPPAALAAAGLVLALALGAWSLLPPDRLLAPSVPRDFAPGQRVLAVSEGLHETLAVIEVPGVERRLFTNGHSMSSSHRFAQRYMRLFAHVPLLQMEEPRSVLVVCFGVGNTLHAASLHPSVERLEAVDLSENVVRHGAWFAGSNGGVLGDPRVHVFVNDGRQHLRMQPPGSYDLVTLEPPPISYAGVAGLYSREFYALARSRLRQGGAVTQWLPAYQVDAPATLSIVRAFLDVFPDAVLLSGYQSEFILLGSTSGPPQIDLDALRRRLRERPEVKRDLRRIDVETPTALVGTFVADAGTLAEAAAGVRPVTDDHPLMEYSVRSRLFETRLPPAIFGLSRVERWCPSCFRDGAPRDAVAHLPGHLAALDAWYAEDAFRIHRSREAASYSPRPRPPGDPAAQAAVRASRYLGRFIRVPEAPLAREGVRSAARAGSSDPWPARGPCPAC